MDLQNYSKLVQLSFSGLVTRAGGSGKGGRDGERGGCKYLGQIYRCIVGFLALKFTRSCHFNKSGSLPKRLNLFPIIGALEMIYANVLDSTNEGQVFTDKSFCDNQ